MPPNDSNSRALWLIVESILGALLLLIVGLLVDVRTNTAAIEDRVVTLERRMDADEADEFTTRDALAVWKEIKDLAAATARINPAIEREFSRIDARIKQLEDRLNRAP
jgi:hypothetical protein